MTRITGAPAVALLLVGIAAALLVLPSGPVQPAAHTVAADSSSTMDGLPLLQPLADLTIGSVERIECLGIADSKAELRIAIQNVGGRAGKFPLYTRVLVSNNATGEYEERWTWGFEEGIPEGSTLTVTAEYVFPVSSGLTLRQRVAGDYTIHVIVDSPPVPGDAEFTKFYRHGMLMESDEGNNVYRLYATGLEEWC